MTTLYDEFMVADKDIVGGRKLFVETRAAAKNVTAIDVQLVADYCGASKWNREKWDGNRYFSELPNIMPPWSPMWAEFRMPTGNIERNCPVPEPVRFGVLLSKIVGVKTGIFCVRTDVIARFSNGSIAYASNSPLYAEVSENGEPVGHWRCVFSDEDEEEFASAVTARIYPVFAALCFLHCRRQVSLIDVPIDPDANRIRRRQGKPAFAKFKTLEVEPLKEILRLAAQGGAHESPALHLVRGHFKRYSEEKPLFGKYAGVWWHDQHIRGDPDKGVVEKDYKIVLPAEVSR